MSAEIKACVFCKHCDYEEPYSYSEYTDGGGYTDCLKGHFCFETDMGAPHIFVLAESCKDYELRDDIKKTLEAKAQP